MHNAVCKAALATLGLWMITLAYVKAATSRSCSHNQDIVLLQLISCWEVFSHVIFSVGNATFNKLSVLSRTAVMVSNIVCKTPSLSPSSIPQDKLVNCFFQQRLLSVHFKSKRKLSIKLNAAYSSQRKKSKLNHDSTSALVWMSAIYVSLTKLS